MPQVLNAKHFVNSLKEGKKQISTVYLIQKAIIFMKHAGY